MMYKQFFAYFLVAVCAVIIGFFASDLMRQKQIIDLPNVLVYPESRVLPPINFKDQDNQQFSNAQLLNKWSLVFFGYTHCPDVCPTTLTTINQAAELLKDHPASKSLQHIFISLDQQRDTVAALKPYLEFFNPAFIGLTGDAASLISLQYTIGIVAIKVDGVNAESYDYDHTASLVLINPAGQLHALFKAPHTGQGLASALQQVIEAYED